MPPFKLQLFAKTLPRCPYSITSTAAAEEAAKQNGNCAVVLNSSIGRASTPQGAAFSLRRSPRGSATRGRHTGATVRRARARSRGPEWRSSSCTACSLRLRRTSGGAVPSSSISRKAEEKAVRRQRLQRCCRRRRCRSRRPHSLGCLPAKIGGCCGHRRRRLCRFLWANNTTPPRVGAPRPAAACCAATALATTATATVTTTATAEARPHCH